jgi:photosystem II stability/assembly factor-like uncharacterized protein
MKRSLVIVPLILAGLMISTVAAQDKSGSDGKSPWESLPIVAPKGDETFHCIAFVSREVGYVAGTKAIYKTEDGCKTWKPVFHAAFLKAGHIDFLRFQDAQHGWLGCNSKVYFTEDGGASWEPVDDGLGSADIAFGPGGWILVVGGKNGVMQRRGPKGKWEPLDFARAAEWNGSFHAVRFVAITGEQSALVVLNGNLSSDCRIMRTTDGGKTWKEVLKREFRIQGMHFTDAGAAGDRLCKDLCHGRRRRKLEGPDQSGRPGTEVPGVRSRRRHLRRRAGRERTQARVHDRRQVVAVG